MSALFQGCQQRFVRAAKLLEINDTEVSRIRDSIATDLKPMLYMYETICTRYVKEVYTPQIDLFESKDPLEHWRRYYYHVLVPRLVARDDIVRNVLKATAMLPSKNADEAMIALDEIAKNCEIQENQFPMDPSET